MKPSVLITAGDPAGVGPEITVKALRDPAVRRACEPFLIGDEAALRAAGWRPGLAPLIPLSSGLRRFRPGPAAASGLASYKAVLLAAKLMRGGSFSALCTAPVSKEAWALARTPHPAHTELFRDLTKREPLMFFLRGKTRAALVTEHAPLAAVPKLVTRALVQTKALLFFSALRALGLRRPRVGLCALNPHAGDGGVLGREEITTLSPAAAALRARGFCLHGPLPADSAWAGHLRGDTDGLLCLYHDQALAPLKASAPGAPAAHCTWGLPFIRVSPAHGTAFDIAGKNRADWRGMGEALKLAARLAAAQGT